MTLETTQPDVQGLQDLSEVLGVLMQAGEYKQAQDVAQQLQYHLDNVLNVLRAWNSIVDCITSSSEEDA